LKDFANYYADNPSIVPLIECSATSNKDVYNPGEYFAFFGSGVSYSSLTKVTGKVVMTNSLNQTVYRRNYGPANTLAFQPFNVTLLSGIAQPFPDNYTFVFQIFSQTGEMIASSSKVITVNP
jgi:hypothetical protein